MSDSPSLPPTLDSLTTEQCRQVLAGLIDPQAERPRWYADVAKALAIRFCAALPRVYGDELDRLSMWTKIAAAVEAGYAKTVSGDVDLFAQSVLQSLCADPARAVACEELSNVMDELQHLKTDDAQEWLNYLATHLIPVLAHARRAWKERNDG